MPIAASMWLSSSRRVAHRRITRPNSTEKRRRWMERTGYCCCGGGISIGTGLILLAVGAIPVMSYPSLSPDGSRDDRHHRRTSGGARGRHSVPGRRRLQDPRGRDDSLDPVRLAQPVPWQRRRGDPDEVRTPRTRTGRGPRMRSSCGCSAASSAPWDFSSAGLECGSSSTCSRTTRSPRSRSRFTKRVTPGPVWSLLLGSQLGRIQRLWRPIPGRGDASTEQPAAPRNRGLPFVRLGGIRRFLVCDTRHIDAPRRLATRIRFPSPAPNG